MSTLEDVSAEGVEMFEANLSQASEGLTVGDEDRAVIEITDNDGESPIILYINSKVSMNLSPSLFLLSLPLLPSLSSSADS